ncbi:hypothetical protein B0H17DRAFT_1216485 [Mycena rosella]|uniref:Uncharacterized protein n=1 Tax=Mycena rosella TaxID=1033263 RepID=A0AAD7C734_MYCRO|nr:hypothetical protein B0H17DRAFT_1216485 [Mycena rosella]
MLILALFFLSHHDALCLLLLSALPHDSDLPSQAPNVYYLVTSPQAKAPGPGVYPSWSSAQRVAENIPHGGASTFPPTMPACLDGTCAVMLGSTTTCPTPKAYPGNHSRPLPPLSTAPPKADPSPPRWPPWEALRLPILLLRPHQWLLVPPCPQTQSKPGLQLCMQCTMQSVVVASQRHPVHQHRRPPRRPCRRGHSIPLAKELADGERAAAQVEVLGPTPHLAQTFSTRHTLAQQLHASLRQLDLLQREEIMVDNKLWGTFEDHGGGGHD